MGRSFARPVDGCGVTQWRAGNRYHVPLLDDIHRGRRDGAARGGESLRGPSLALVWVWLAGRC